MYQLAFNTQYYNVYREKKRDVLFLVYSAELVKMFHSLPYCIAIEQSLKTFSYRNGFHETKTIT